MPPYVPLPLKLVYYSLYFSICQYFFTKFFKLFFAVLIFALIGAILSFGGIYMDIKALLKSLENCPCGKEHTVNIKAVEIGRGLKEKTAEILTNNGFPKNILVVADKNTIAAADGITEILEKGGFKIKLQLYDNLRTAHQDDVDKIIELSRDTDGVLSVGTGSLNDICRRACLLSDREFAIFATAPSMDGFASDSAPITHNNFKVSLPARQPSVIIGDTDILAAAPTELKASGYGDMLAKYVGIADWKIANAVIGEYYCENVANVTRSAVRRIVDLTDKITQNDPEAAGAVMEALVMTGIAMKLAGCTRPASGTEHIISHFWEVKKLEKGLLSDFHGKKVGVATLMTSRLYYDICENADPDSFTADTTDWDKVYEIYGPNFREDIEKLNSPTVTDKTSPEILREKWSDICRFVKEELPPPDEILSLLRRAGAATELDDIAVEENLGLTGLEFHPYMRHRITLARLLPMLNCKVDYKKIADV